MFCVPCDHMSKWALTLRRQDLLPPGFVSHAVNTGGNYMCWHLSGCPSADSRRGSLWREYGSEKGIGRGRGAPGHRLEAMEHGYSGYATPPVAAPGLRDVL